jgi:nucleobase:cation symporter-1, NCS1 family
MTTHTAPDNAVDEHALDPVADDRRESTAMHQFWIWAGANIAPINWVLGALGIVLGLGLRDTIVVLVLGNLIGMAIFGFFVLMGQRTGVSQMVLTRSAFGRRGAYLPAVIQGVTSAGWCAINTWIVLDLVLALLAKLGVEGSTGLKIVIVLVVMGLQTWIAANGFRWIAAFEKYTVPVTLVVVLAMSVVAWSSLGVHWDFRGQGLTGSARLSAMSTVLTAIGIGWGITWLAYASDYSRFVPRSMPKRRLYLASVLGQFIPVIWLGVLGATVATIGQDADPGQLIVKSFGPLAIPVLLLVLHGPIATNILNIYSCSLCALTVDWKVSRRTLSYLVGVFAAAFTILLIFQESFAHALDGWLASIVVWVAPWAAIMAVHFYVVRRQEIDVPALYDPPGRSRIGDIRWDAVISFAAGIVATWFFQFGIPAALQGPGAKMLGNVDLSWLAGMLVAGGLYAVLSRGQGVAGGVVGRSRAAAPAEVPVKALD